MVDVQGTKIAFQRSQAALKVASIVCGVIALALFGVFMSIAFGIIHIEDLGTEASGFITYLVINGSLGLVGFAFNFVALDYCLRARIKELPRIIEAESADLVTRFGSKLKAHSIVLLVLAWLGVAQAAASLFLTVVLPAPVAFFSVSVEWEIMSLLVGLTPCLVHFKLAKTLSDESKILVGQLN